MYAQHKFPADEFDLSPEYERFHYVSCGREWEAETNRSSRDYIKWVQQSLNHIMGLRLAVDGNLGGQSRCAIRSFQQRQGLVVDGIVGAKTEAAIRAALDSSGLLAAHRIGLEAQPRSGHSTGSGNDICEVIDEFDFNSPNVKDGHPHHQSQLNKILAQLIAVASHSNNRVAIRFIGHTDRVGNDAYNDQLGLKRANSVRSVLMRKLQAQPNLRSHVDFRPAETRGEREPLTDNARSRRVQVCFLVVQPKPAPLGRVVTKNFEVVVKSFIAPFGSAGVGSPTCSYPLPGPVIPTSATMRLRAFATATLAAIGGGEDPLSARKDKTYRLFTKATLAVDCQDGQIVGSRHTALTTDVGLECLPDTSTCLTPPPLNTSSLLLRRVGPNIVEYSWWAWGRPHNAAEVGFQAVCPRTSRFIWHSIQIQIEAITIGAIVRNVILMGSQFPSHRVFVNGRKAADLPQGQFRNLWIPDPADRTRVR